MKLQFTRVIIALLMMVGLTATALAQIVPPAPPAPGPDKTVTCDFGKGSASSGVPKDGTCTFKNANTPGVTGGDFTPPPGCPTGEAPYTWELVEHEGRKDYKVYNDDGILVASFSGVGDANTTGRIGDAQANNGNANGKWGGRWN